MEVRPLDVSNVKIAFFENEKYFSQRFARTFDKRPHYLPQNIEHEWKSGIGQP
jgi:hypothetical protein